MINQITELLERRVAEIIKRDHLKTALESGRKLKIKFGIDPTSAKLHLGHTVPLLKLKEFQNLGHQIILIIGDTTATIGDPTGRQISRKTLTRKEVEENMKAYKGQISKILDAKKTTFVYNSEWFGKMGISDFMKMVSTATFQQVGKRRELQERIQKGEDITLTEILYPVMQGYDSVQVKADVEVGGADQKFNLLMGRQIQKRFGQKEQDILTVPLLIGTDGKEKMSKTAENYVALEDSPSEMYAKLMATPDGLTVQYFELCTDLTIEKVEDLAKQAKKDPMGVKKQLAYEITKMYHGEKKATTAQKEFGRVFSKGGTPKDAPVWKIAGREVDLAKLLLDNKIVTSKSDARRLIQQGGVKLDGKKLTKPIATLGKGTLRIGRKTFIKIQ
ncbi:MAG: tyrosine--tRNA ligase [Patescibacteria group bacterium]|nr:MAG: tyrosine--tRNA ligase [Patescibacteria group bacterium]